MKRVRFTLAVILTIGLVAGAALAQDAADQPDLQVMQSERFREYLADSEGRALYIFAASDVAAEDMQPMTDGVRETAVSCTEACLEAWPAFTADGDVQAPEGVDGELLYTASFDDRTHVVFNGWPLFYFAQDDEPGDTNGHGIESFGGVWYLIGPDGQYLEFVDPAEEAG
jgi:predicted lipoprotein with Yx(FWY)xxD motif